MMMTKIFILNMYSDMNSNGEHSLHEMDENDDEDSNCGNESWSEVSSTDEDTDDDDENLCNIYIPKNTASLYEYIRA